MDSIIITFINTGYISSTNIKFQEINSGEDSGRWETQCLGVVLLSSVGF